MLGNSEVRASSNQGPRRFLGFRIKNFGDRVKDL